MTEKTCVLPLANSVADVQVSFSICSPWLVTIKMLAIERRVDIKNEVDSSGGKVRHARVVVDRRINGIDSDTILAMEKSERTC